MSAQLSAARALAGKGAKRQCQRAMAAAHGLFWQIYGAKVGVLLLLGTDVTPAAVWKAADEQGKLDSADKERLEAAKGYLFGSVKLDRFNATKFEEAATLMEQLVAVPANP